MFNYKYSGEKEFVDGNRLTLLTDGNQFFPQLIRRIRQARYEIFIETFILTDDRVGKVLLKAILRAAKRGVWVSITADSYGSFFLPQEYIERLTEAGVIFQIYDPQPSWLNSRPKVFRRLHRKLVVIDCQVAFIGGINLCEEHITRPGDQGKRDYAAEVEGPVVKKIRRLCKSYVREAEDSKIPLDVIVNSENQRVGSSRVAFVTRDNRFNRSEIEKAYLKQIRAAKRHILIANAYFFPGYRIMRSLRKAAERGVKVQVVLQGNPDIAFALRAARSLYARLTRAGVEIFEYTERPLHGKVATIDDDWSTIGSSNLDPWSLGLNLEANIMVEDTAFNHQLTQGVEALMKQSELIQYSWVKERPFMQAVKDTLAYHLMRWWPDLIHWIPNSRQKITQFRYFFTTAEADRAHPDHPQSPKPGEVSHTLSKKDITI